MIPYGRQDITHEDIEAVLEVLKSDFLTQGPKVPAFETAVCDYVGAAYGVAVNSATSALHIACLAIDLGPGDWLWTSPNTFVASANCGRYCGASIDFVDIDPVTLNLSIECLKEKLSNAEKQGLLPKVLVPVHFAGEPCDMQEIARLAKQYGFRVIEDASHAIGAKYADHYVGNCEYSDITVFSFHPVKIITTAEGGIATTNNAELANRMARLRTHGITRDPKFMTSKNPDEWYYEQTELGFNYRMTDIQAALGLSQLSRLTTYINTRHSIASQYDRELRDLPLTCPYRNPRNRSAIHLYPLQLRESRLRKQLFHYLKDNAIGANIHYIPVYLQPYFKKLSATRIHCENAEAYFSKAISIPMHTNLTNHDIENVIGLLRSFFTKTL